MRSRALVLSLGLALLLTALPMLAQLPTGTIAGKVSSAEGEALPGVTVTVSSPALQGTRTTTTTEAGEYNIPFLPPGEYEVSFELEGFSNPKQSVKISAAQNTRLDAELSNASVAEEIVVTGTYETISTSQQAATTYEKEFIESLPVERNIRETVLLTPGVAATGPNAAGANAARQRGISVAGSQSFESLFLVNGVVVNENVRGQALPLFIEDAIEETTTTVSGISAEYGRFSGGVVNTITKSGGNETHGTFRTSFTNQDWSEKTPVTQTQTDEINERYEATLGGWLWKDKIWYFLAGRDFAEAATAQTSKQTPASVPVSYATGGDQQRYEGKVTLSPFQGHRLVGSYISLEEEEIGNKFGNVLDTRSVITRSLPQELMAVNYTGVITENFFVEAQYSEREFLFENAGAPSRDLIDGTLMVDFVTGNRWWSPTFCGVCTTEERSNENILLKGSWFLSTEGLGSHDLAFGYDTFDDKRLANNHQSGSDFRIITLGAIDRGGVIYPVMATDPSVRGSLNQWIQYNPILKSAETTKFLTNSIFLNDKWRLNDNWSFNVGVRYDQNDGEDSEGKKVADDSRISPRLSAAFDPKADGNWVFTASYGEYVSAVANNQANATSSAGNSAALLFAYRGPAINSDPNGPLVSTPDAIRAIFNWFNSPEVGGVNSQAFSVTIPGGTTIIKDSLDSPFAREYSIGAAKRLGRRGVARVDYVHRDYEDFYSTRTDLSTGQVIVNGSAADLSFLENSNDGIERVYDGFHTQAQLRLSDRLNIGAVYTWSHLRGNFDGETSANGPVSALFNQYPEYKEARWNSPRGDLALDQRHRASLWVVYDIFQTSNHSLSASVLQSYASGLPYGALGRANSAAVVTNPGYALPPGTSQINYYYTNRDAFRTDDITSTDISLNYGFQWAALGKDLEIFLQPEILNVFNEHGLLNANQAVNNLRAFNPFTETPVEGVHWSKGANFGKGTAESDYQLPRTFRFSVGLRF